MNEDDEKREAIESMAELTPEQTEKISGGGDGAVLEYECPGCGLIITAGDLPELKQKITEHNYVCPGPPFPII